MPMHNKENRSVRTRSKKLEDYNKAVVIGESINESIRKA
jgi:hypothetical protein